MLHIWTTDDDPPCIDEVRPRSCRRCGALGVVDGRVVLHGHGVRHRGVVLPGEEHARFIRVWVRRFRCTACEATCSVLPPGVIPGHLYSLFAILTAWFLATAPPIGEGLDDEEVYNRQGLDHLTPEKYHNGRPRWRSLARWAGSLDVWWPARVVLGDIWRDRVRALIGGLQTAGGPGWLAQAVRGAVF